jgi:hypothetical protein
VPGADGADGAAGATGPNEVTASTASDLSGILKGTGTAIAVATAGTDYLLPPLSFTDTSVADTLWAADTTYTGYGYKADITLTGVTDAMLPEVVFRRSMRGAAICAVGYERKGYVRIYAKAAQSTFTVPLITDWR